MKKLSQMNGVLVIKIVIKLTKTLIKTYNLKGIP